MATLHVRIPHKLSEQQVKIRIKSLIKRVTNEYADKVSNVRERWKGSVGHFDFKALGFAVSGTIAIESDAVVIDGTLPLAASFYRKKIEALIKREAERLLQ